MNHPKNGKVKVEKMSLKQKLPVLCATLIVFLFTCGNCCVVFGEQEQRVVEKKPIIKKGLVILVKFKGLEYPIQRNFAVRRFEGLNNYIKEMSYGDVSIDVDVTNKWYELKDVSNYKISPRNLEVDKSKVENLIKDAVNAADKEYDFSKYTFTALFMMSQIKDFGMVGLCGYPGMLGWQADTVLRTDSDQAVKGGVAIFCYVAHLGTLFHDTAHILGGVENGKRMVPCLYDHDLQAQPGPIREIIINAMINMGFWDPMSCHFYKHEVPPPGISSWTKMRLDWIDKSKVRIVDRDEKKEILLDPLNDNKANVLVIKIPLTKSTYYLIENRQPIGYDKNLPDSGVLIMFADDTIPECRHGKAPVKLIDANPKIPHLEGAAFDIGKNDRYLDEKNNVKIRLLEKKDNSYKIVVEH
jgi:hypothetical protein